MNLSQNLRVIQQAWAADTASIARWAHLPIERVEQLVRGEAEGLTSRELYGLADGVAMDPADLLKPLASSPSRTPVRFKQGAEGVDRVAPADLRLFARAAQVGRVGLRLWNAVHAEAVPVTALRRPEGAPEGHAGEAGTQLGWSSRASLPEGPIVDLQALVEALGVHVARVDMETPTLLGVTLCVEDALPIVLLNEASFRVRDPLLRRAVLAHELCHVLYDGRPERAWHLILTRSEGSDPVESRANAFAPAFLAPWSQVDGRDDAGLVADLVRRWGLPAECAAWYAINQLSLNPMAFESLAFEARRARPAAHFEVARPPLALPSDRVEVSSLVDGLIARLAVDAQEHHAISTARLVEILEMR